jgi:aspartate 1-decarboxylase
MQKGISYSQNDVFSSIYNKHYINSQLVFGRYSPLEETGDMLIIATYGNYNEQELKKYEPLLVYVNMKNEITISKHSIAIQAA